LYPSIQSLPLNLVSSKETSLTNALPLPPPTFPHPLVPLLSSPTPGTPPDDQGGVQGNPQGDLRHEASEPAPRQETHPAQMVHQEEAGAAAAGLRRSAAPLLRRSIAAGLQLPAAGVHRPLQLPACQAQYTRTVRVSTRTFLGTFLISADSWRFSIRISLCFCMLTCHHPPTFSAVVTSFLDMLILLTY
jgi:hypothetical protein